MGFNFCGTHSDNYGICVSKIKRPLLSELEKNEVKITGKHGSYDFGNSTYLNRVIEMDITISDDSRAKMIAKVRKIAAWLSQKGELIFDDEPDIHYIGRIYSSVPLETLIIIGTCTIIFDCEPFGYSEEKVTELQVTENNQNLTVESQGTFETPLRIKLKNTGTNTINQLTLIKIK